MKDLVRKDAGLYSIKAENCVGSKITNFSIVVMERPSMPTGPFEISEISSRHAVLSWSPSEEDGGAAISHYVVDKRDSSNVWVEVSGFVAVTTHKVTRLQKGMEYTFRVRACNRFGISDALESKRVVANHPFKRPSIPGTPKATAVTKESARLTWQEPTSDGGSQVLGYHVEYKDTSAISWTKANCYLVKENTFMVKNLTPCLCYEFRVVAENIAGE